MRSDAPSNTTDKKVKQLSDKWITHRVQTKLPQNVIRAFGQPNMYVALWFRQGKPVLGQAWNDSGVMQCAFGCDEKVFKGKDVGNGTIQLLMYEGNHVTNNFYYEWVSLSEWKSAPKDNSTRELVLCGSLSPIFWKEKCVLGGFDTTTETAVFAECDNFLKVNDASTLGKMLLLFRNTGGGPPGCLCVQCADSSSRTSKLLIVNDWGDFCVGSQWPTDKPIMRALNRPLNTPRGPQDHFVSLWYHHGKPCMGRAWNNVGKIDASFVDSGREFTGEIVGSLQMLVEIPATAAGFEYCWLPYEQASRYIDKDFAPVHMSHVAPCVVQMGPYEILGSVNLKQERAEAAFDGRVITLDGPKIQKLKVLCRKDRDDTLAI
ncbi:hypothetical protein DICVIV_07271 [Dictyocaulus viviparus]|uniref:Uncharacterized protein n=1 Tax=Dictyocaulus viviparus TaxID=29172 RepID=A0A0D8XPT5_DICVI|nr:hypothetical protein DICVIV_07271 [Dictyocaulus viviparus]